MKQAAHNPHYSAIAAALFQQLHANDMQGDGNQSVLSKTALRQRDLAV
jgi:hypothetical protein